MPSEAFMVAQNIRGWFYDEAVKAHRSHNVVALNTRRRVWTLPEALENQ